MTERESDWIPPMLATLAPQAFSRPGWLFEPKLDGLRCIAVRDGDDIRLYSRNQNLFNGRFPSLVRALAAQRRKRFVIDGEIAVFVGGVSSFSALQQGDAGDLRLCPFDVLRLDDRDTRALPQRERKALLETSFDWRDPLQYVAHRETDGEAFHREACASGWEGIIAKDGAAPYVSGRSRVWLKFKCVNSQELVIVGYTDPEGTRIGLGALLVGYYDNGKLRFAGKVGTGFNTDLLKTLAPRLERLGTDAPPVVDKMPKSKSVHWVRPELVAQIGFAEWTPGGRLRHPRFEGLRDDKDPHDVTRERRG